MRDNQEHNQEHNGKRQKMFVIKPVVHLNDLPSLEGMAEERGLSTQVIASPGTKCMVRVGAMYLLDETEIQVAIIGPRSGILSLIVACDHLCAPVIDRSWNTSRTRHRLMAAD